MTAKRERLTDGIVPGGFGFDPVESKNHFLVFIPRTKAGMVEVSEHFDWDEGRGSSPVTISRPHEDGQMRVQLPLAKWEVIADHVRATFNQTLRESGRRAAVGKRGCPRFRGCSERNCWC